MKAVHLKPLANNPDRYVGAVVRAARRERKLRQEEVAEKIGMSAPNLSKLEDGKLSLRLRDLPRLAHALGIDIATLIPPWWFEGRQR